MDKSYKIAVASSDEKSINEHFGLAEQFLIYGVEDNLGYTLAEVRRTRAACGSPDIDAMQKSVDLLADCKVVLAAQLGPCAEQKLREKGILYYTLNQGIDLALPKLIEYLSKQKL